MKEFVCTEDFIGYLGREYKVGDIVDERNHYSIAVNGTVGRGKFKEIKKECKESLPEEVKINKPSKSEDSGYISKKYKDEELNTYLGVLYVASVMEENN